MTFGEKLKKLRTNAQLTQDELAEKLYVSRTAISKWESDRGYPNIESLKAIALFRSQTVCGPCNCSLHCVYGDGQTHLGGALDHRYYRRRVIQRRNCDDLFFNMQ